MKIELSDEDYKEIVRIARKEIANWVHNLSCQITEQVAKDDEERLRRKIK